MLCFLRYQRRGCDHREVVLSLVHRRRLAEESLVTLATDERRPRRNECLRGPAYERYAALPRTRS